MSNSTEAQELTVFGQMVEELRDRLANGEELDDIKDEQGEIVDSYLPVYNGRILDAWRDMPSDYDDTGAEELGTTGGIYNLMSADLYLYYTVLFNDAVAEVEEELADAEISRRRN